MSGSVSEHRALLEAVVSEESLDRALRALWTRRSKWRKDLVLFYLPEKWHEAASRYFDGDRLRAPDHFEKDWSRVVSVSLETALSAVEQLPPADVSWKNAYQRRRGSGFPSGPGESAPPTSGPTDVVGHVLGALYDEIRSVQRTKISRFRATKVSLQGTYQWGVAYGCRFARDREPELNDVGWLESEAGVRVSATVVEVNPRHHVIVAESEVALTGGTVSFVRDPAALLRVEFKQLEMLRDTERGVLLARSGRPLEIGPDSGLQSTVELSGVSARQLAAINTVRRFGTSFVWGPPGTGKTTTLAALLEALVREGRRVLMLSNNNVAVDQAVAAAARRGGWSKQSIVRLGRASPELRRAELATNQSIHMNSHLERFAETNGVLEAALRLASAAAREAGIEKTSPASVQGALSVLQKATEKLAEAGSAYAVQNMLPRALRNLRAQFRQPELDVLANASVVATTLTMEMLSPILAGLVFDQVIVDEASVMRTSEVVRLVLRRGGRIAFFGDPQQLPPVVTANTARVKRWLCRNPFDLAGIKETSDVREGCVFLNEQHRMAPPIASLISTSFYQGDLLSGSGAPRTGRIVLIDTSRTEAACHREYLTNGYSRFNREHAQIGAIVADTAHRQNGHWSIRAMTPFRSQRKEYERHEMFRRVASSSRLVGTIHASQGAEADLVVVDITVAPGGNRSRFLDERFNSSLRNLVNVAFSRTRHVLVIIAHLDHLRGEYEGLLITKLLGKVRSEHKIVDAAEGIVSQTIREVLRELASSAPERTGEGA